MDKFLIRIKRTRDNVRKKSKKFVRSCEWNRVTQLWHAWRHMLSLITWPGCFEAHDKNMGIVFFLFSSFALKLLELKRSFRVKNVLDSSVETYNHNCFIKWKHNVTTYLSTNKFYFVFSLKKSRQWKGSKKCHTFPYVFFFLSPFYSPRVSHSHKLMILSYFWKCSITK